MEVPSLDQHVPGPQCVDIPGGLQEQSGNMTQMLALWWPRSPAVQDAPLDHNEVGPPVMEVPSSLQEQTGHAVKPRVCRLSASLNYSCISKPPITRITIHQAVQHGTPNIL